MTPLRRELAHLSSAIAFLTVLPVPDTGWEEDRLARASAWFPAVGLLVGGASVAVWWLAPGGPAVAAGLALLAGILLTGALHEDGLADTADGLGGRDRAHRLEIMGDSRIGAFGVLALVFSVGLRWTALATVPVAAPAALVLAPVAGRALMVPVAWRLPYARDRGTGSLAKGVGGREVALALAFAVVVAVATGGLGALLAAAVVGVLAMAFLYRRLGGYTGDGLGAICQLGEVTVIVVACA